ncbi:MAG: aminoacetone oxidase family FAD-binding enzyme [Gemmatimonadetes bacterium]|nr:aminoacetone oxidase family FAD-binding enzyme [Gemmatimonadota bacterium]
MAVIVVIGAGAAGFMAAIQAARTGQPVTLLERTADGARKVLISGGGRCNILPSELDERRFVTDSSRHTMAKILRSWPVAAQRDFFEQSLGVPLALEPATGKLFPVSNKAREVRDALLFATRQAGTRVRFGATVTAVTPAAGGWQVGLGDGSLERADRIILATGGLSVPATGSDGFGLSVARQLGHTIHQTYPALTPLVADPAVHAGLAGVSLEVTLRGRDDQGRDLATTGGFLFTHRGYSGPTALDLSHLAVRSRLAGGPRAEIRAQWTRHDRETWEGMLRSQGRQSVATVVRRELPTRLADRLLEEAGISADRTLAQLGKDERRVLVGLLTDYELPWTGDEGYRKAEVTGGGLALSEVNPETLESRRFPGLFFCGEMLDAFGPIGGYNFAWAWATGRAAALGAAAS